MFVKMTPLKRSDESKPTFPSSVWSPCPRSWSPGSNPLAGTTPTSANVLSIVFRVHTNWSTLGQRIRFPFMLKPMC